MKKGVLNVLTALLLVLAGCSGSSPAVTETERGTGTDMTSLDTADTDQPNGVTASGVSERELYNTSIDALSNESYTIDYEITAGERGINSGTIRVSDGKRMLLSDGTYATKNVSQFDIEQYSTGASSNERDQRIAEITRSSSDENPYRVVVYPGGSLLGVTPMRQALAQLKRFELERSGTTTRNGRPLVVIEVTTVKPRMNERSGDGTVTASGRILVSEEGVIVDADYTMTIRANGQTRATQYGWELRDVGETEVERPNWLSEARTWFNDRNLGSQRYD